ncbi:SLAM family member 5-like isoform 2-T3 [Anomaloglossus baeobatrachus]
MTAAAALLSLLLSRLIPGEFSLSAPVHHDTYVPTSGVLAFCDLPCGTEGDYNVDHYKSMVFTYYCQDRSLHVYGGYKDRTTMDKTRGCVNISDVRDDDAGRYFMYYTDKDKRKTFLGTVNCHVMEGEAGGQPVAGLLHQSVELCPLNLSRPVLEVTWKFETQEKTRKMAMYHTDKVTLYDAQFTDRLELSNNGAKLRINDLRMEDTGVYTEEVTFTNHEMSQITFVLTVYEPVPQPQVIKMMENTAEQCHVTLHCSVTQNMSDLSYTWKSRHRYSPYQPYSNGSIIQISVPPDHQDMEYLCIVHNPADQKNVSTSVNYCNTTGRPRHQLMLYIVPAAIILCTGIILIITWKIRKSK